MRDNRAQDNADIIKGRREAEAALAAGMADYEADGGEPDDAWWDLVVATAHNIILEDKPFAKEIATEFCRTQLGVIPLDLEPYLGKKDWVQ